MRKSFLIAIAAGAFALGGVAYAGGTKTPVQPTVQAPVPMTNMQMQKVTAGGSYLLQVYGLYTLQGETPSSGTLCVLPAAASGPSYHGNFGAGNYGPCPAP